jgi:hypothetical protein
MPRCLRPILDRSAPRVLLLLALATVPTLVTPRAAAAQSRVGADSSTRTRRYRHDLLYGASLGFVYAGVDQLRNDPPEWGKGWRGYEKRVASDIGEFVIQETVTDVIAAGLNRPLDYQRCRCAGFGNRVGWALEGAITDPLPNGRRALALPRIVGAYAGSFAQAAWRPAPTTGGRTRVALVNGTTSLLIGAGINLYYELRGR